MNVPQMRNSMRSHPEHFHHFISQMIDHLHCYPPCFGLVKRARCVAVQCCPGFFIDLDFKGCLEGLVRIVRAQKVGVANKEAFFVIVSIDEPARDPLGAIAAHLTGVGVKNIDSIDLDLNLSVSGSIMSMSGSPNMTNRLPLPVFLSSSDMCKSAFMRAFSTGILPSLSNSVDRAS